MNAIFAVMDSSCPYWNRSGSGTILIDINSILSAFDSDDQIIVKLPVIIHNHYLDDRSAEYSWFLRLL